MGHYQDMKPLPALPAPEENATFGSRLRFARVARKLSCNRLGELADLGVGYVSRLERGTRGGRTSTQVIRSLAAALDVPFDWLDAGDMSTLNQTDVLARLERLEQRLAHKVSESGRPPPMADETPAVHPRVPGQKRPSSARNRAR